MLVADLALEVAVVDVLIDHVTSERCPEVELLAAVVTNEVARGAGAAIAIRIPVTIYVSEKLLPRWISLTAQVTNMVQHIRMIFSQMSFQHQRTIERFLTIRTVVRSRLGRVSPHVSPQRCRTSKHGLANLALHRIRHRVSLVTMRQHFLQIREPFMACPTGNARIALRNVMVLTAMPHQFALVVEGLFAQPAGDAAVG